jgi:Fe-S cluster assembly iron-binding protein IscA
MLTITGQAAETIRGIVDDSDVGPNGGLRISGSNDGNGETALDFDVADGPAEGDETVQSEGATVFLDESAAAVLGDKQLDVHAHGDHVHFSIDEQDAAS